MSKTPFNLKYDVCNCISQSEDVNPGVLSMKTEFMKVYERACHEDWTLLYIRPFLEYSYGRWWCDTFQAGKFILCILYKQVSRTFSNSADNLSEVMHFIAREVWRAIGEFVVMSDVLWNIYGRHKLIRTRSIFK